jgi:hypothetical protein
MDILALFRVLFYNFLYGWLYLVLLSFEVCAVLHKDRFVTPATNVCSGHVRLLKCLYSLALCQCRLKLNNLVPVQQELEKLNLGQVLNDRPPM